jgi:pimeloyl-ACP methyl ester carboxylesterase
MHPRSATLAGLVALWATSALPAQARRNEDLRAGWSDVGFVNRTASGSAILQSRVFYPSLEAGQDTAMLARAGGWPVYVFLHGQGSLGRAYFDIANRVVQRGFVAVMCDTAQNDGGLLVLDATALFHTLRVENTTLSSRFFGALDMGRAVLAGYSMGGGSMLRCLANNPGYRAGFGHAPTGTGASTLAASIRVPFVLVHGLGDTVLNWQTTSQVWFQGARNHNGVKALYLMDQSCDHLNVASIPSWDAFPVFERTLKVATSFFDAEIHGRHEAWDRVLGDDARAEPRLVRLLVEVERPRLWLNGQERAQGTLALRLAAEPGPGAVWIAGAPAQIQTPWGLLELDPMTMLLLARPDVDSTRCWGLDVPIPDDPSLIGVPLPLQAAGLSNQLGPRLTNPVSLWILP